MPRLEIRNFLYKGFYLRQALEISSADDEENLSLALEEIRQAAELEDLTTQEFITLVKTAFARHELKLIAL